MKNEKLKNETPTAIKKKPNNNNNNKQLLHEHTKHETL